MHTAPPLSPILLSRDTCGHVFKQLPSIARSALKIAMSIDAGSLEITTPDQRRFRIEGSKPGPHADLTIHKYSAIRRLLRSSDIGFAEAYLDDEWSSSNVTDLLEVFIRNRDSVYRKIAGGPLARIWLRMLHWLNRNTHSGSKRNISAHYDLGNSFYQKWLDPSMTYSSAYYGDGVNDLSAAQISKYRKLAQDTGITAADSVLEIGCGWGGFAEFAAKEIGCSVTGLTISKEQFDFAKKRIFEAGLNDKVDIKYQDYRDETGRYDRVTSIEMFEAVGEKYWPVFFDKMGACLKDGGTAGLQVIAIQDEAFQTYRAQTDFIQRYIFPGGMLPTPSIMKSLGTHAGLPLRAETVFGRDYARTLSEWRGRFDENWLAIKQLGFDERFKKLWRYYLHYCEAGFRSGHIDVRQMIFCKQ